VPASKRRFLPSSRAVITLGLALLAGAMVLFLTRISFLHLQELFTGLELRTVDYRYRLRGPQPPRSDIVIVAVDESSIKRLGGWPFPWDVPAELINTLTAAGARAIAFDIFYVDAGRQGTEALAEATRRSGRVIHALYQHKEAEKTLGPEEQAALERFALEPRVRGSGGVHTFEGLSPPVATVARGSAGLGYVDLPTSADNTFRSVFYLASCQGRFYPSLAMAVALFDLGLQPDQVTLDRGHALYLGAKRRIPVDEGGSTLINFPGEAETYKPQSLATVLEDGRRRPEAVRRQFAGKIVLVGATAYGLYDVRASPFSRVYFGVEDQASALADILNDRFLREARPEANWALLLALALLVGLVAPRLAPLPGALAAALVILGYDLVAFELFAHERLVVEIVPPNAAVALAYVAILVYLRLTGERERLRLRATFARYVPEQMVDRLTRISLAAMLEGERREVTVLFSDIRNFTAMSEKLQPEDTVALLNRYFTLMHDVVWKFDGTLDKYMGDAIMAVWNAPTDQPNHVEMAAMAALEMQRQVEANRAEWAFLGMPELRVGMGLHTGVAVAGNVGSRQRIQYTVIGDDVNLASRLQDLTREYDVPILVSAAVYEAIRHLVEGELVDTVRVRGRSGEVPIYTIRTKTEN